MWLRQLDSAGILDAVIVDRQALRQLSRRSEGSLTELPFAVLLHAMAVTESNLVLVSQEPGLAY